MQPLNLIPFRRLESRRRKALRRRWIAGCSVYAAIVAVAGGAALAIDTQTGSDLQARLASAASEVDRASTDVSKVRGDLDRVSSVLRSSRAIAEQPDWSYLLALMAGKAGPEVTLKGCTVRPRVAATPTAAKPGAKPAAKAPTDPTLLVNVTGLSTSQSAVSQFALRLESTGLFGRVTLLDTAREPFGGRQLVTFRIECTLAEPSKPPARLSTATVGGDR